ncbi:hypothetical protein DFH08DRAFT_882204 [Mycena albidolilacea]|uniref:MYND-type domain-containing protein n=1 Tax=Mycena albidolilacea TaxID=1033008 RepID=A0AAD7EK76_9AGAR|nr:hypothetical protein DFH08DRAFT_882204 [Mycena albidolilacea]
MDGFNPNCPHCVEEHVHQTLNADAPSAPSHRYSTSDPKETLRQCQYCFKSKGAGVTLQRCGTYEIDIYCSKACQRAARKTHKAKCAIDRAHIQRLSTTSINVPKGLRAFSSKHRLTIAEAGVRALGIFGEPTRAERDVLPVLLRPRLDSPRVETTFWVTATHVAPLANFPRAEEMREQLKLSSDANRRSGMAGGLFVVLMKIGQRDYDRCAGGIS